MATYNSVMSRLNELRDHFDGGFSASERDEINQFSIRYLGHPVENLTCGDCYKDAYVQIYAKLSHLGKLPEQRNYVLNKGELLRIVSTGQTYSEPTDEQAEMFLIQFPNCIDMFANYPSDWQERVEKRKKAIYRQKVANEKREAKRISKTNSNAD